MIKIYSIKDVFKNEPPRGLPRGGSLKLKPLYPLTKTCLWRFYTPVLKSQSEPAVKSWGSTQKG